MLKSKCEDNHFSSSDDNCVCWDRVRHDASGGEHQAQRGKMPSYGLVSKWNLTRESKRKPGSVFTVVIALNINVLRLSIFEALTSYLKD
jgi:hypothetical protein